MTTEEAIYEIKQLAVLSTDKNIDRITEALEMAIDALDKVEYLNSQLGKADPEPISLYDSQRDYDYDLALDQMDCPSK